MKNMTHKAYYIVDRGYYRGREADFEKLNLSEQQLILLTPSEENKSMATVEWLWREFQQRKVTRHSQIIIMGGGIILDMAAFAAATYRRGLPFVLVPTTLLAQVDASIGGKVGVNWGGAKNMIGLFAPATEVRLDLSALNTLSERDFRAGGAEIIKHALIADDGGALWRELQATPIKDVPPKLMNKIRAVKEKIVATDPQEKNGRRKVLNLGHNIAHALEALPLGLNHGEAVAYGLWIESALAGDDEKLRLAIRNELLRWGFDLSIDLLPWLDDLLPWLDQDKKNERYGEWSFSVLKKQGDVVVDHKVTKEDLQMALVLSRPLHSVRIPASKSMLLRQQVLNFVRKQDSLSCLLPVEECSLCQDGIVMRKALTALKNRENTINCHLSAAVARFILALLLRFPPASGKTVTITGEKSLLQRPMGPAIEVLRQHGFSVQELSKEHCLPLAITAPVGPFAIKRIKVDCSFSGQFLSGLKLAFPEPSYADYFSPLDEEKVKSRPYITMTEKMIACPEEDLQVQVREGDWSQASTFILRALLEQEAGRAMVIRGLRRPELSWQGDSALLSYLAPHFSACWEWIDDEILVVTPLQKQMQGEVELDLKDTPDLYPSLAVFNSCFSPPLWRFKENSSLRFKESDRLQTVAEGLRTFPHVKTCHDHRIAMAFSLLKQKCPELALDDRSVVAKSYPRFFADGPDASLFLTDRILRVVLTGYRGVGKTTIGHALAKRLSWNFFDLDQEVIAQTGQTIEEMTKDGTDWRYFREKEYEVARSLLRQEKAVIALGGGFAVHDENPALAAEEESFLRSQTKTLIVHIAGRGDSEQGIGRPSLPLHASGHDKEQIFQTRKERYLRLADLSLPRENALSDLRALLLEQKQLQMVLGDPIAHSLSPQIHSEFLQEKKLCDRYIFSRKNVPAGTLAYTLTRLQKLFPLTLNGLAITAPLKEEAALYFASSLPSINSYSFVREESLSTDMVAIKQCLQKRSFDPVHTDVVIMGAGGAAIAAIYALKEMNVSGENIFIFNRHVHNEKAQKLADRLQVKLLEKRLAPSKKTLWINARPAMATSTDYLQMKAKDIAFEMVYEPRITPFMQHAHSAGIISKDQIIYGEEMFLAQAQAQHQFLTESL